MQQHNQSGPLGRVVGVLVSSMRSVSQGAAQKTGREKIETSGERKRENACGQT